MNRQQLMMTPHILIVDDNVPTLHFVSGCIRKFGYNFISVRTAREALEKMRKETVHILLFDLEAPGVTEEKLMYIISREFPATLLIAMSLHNEAQMIVNTLHEYKTYDYLLKPFSETALKKTLDNTFDAYLLRKKEKLYTETEKELYEFFHGAGIGALLSAKSF